MATRTYQEVLRRIEADLADGRLDVGGRLPGERALAERYGVSRSSVREAIRVLEAMGLIRTGVGSGPDAGATVIADPAAPIGAALRWHLASRHLPVADIVGTRVLIESWAVGEAAVREVADADLAPIVDLLDEMDRPDLPVADFLNLDTRFHVALAQLAGNAVIAAVMTAMREAIEQYVTAAVDGYPDWSGMADRLRAEHRGILESVRDGDPGLASERVVAHIQGFYGATGVG
ncbi:GntR family transcriptional regulator [Nakamurella sp. YIM 132087]|uniref:GntR family transcriptional regulator n=1 Tax=Nakamurella alba TaxID=2665158 RepID=A0A7K1FF91_9ACTN|nr:FCD domain-containing protein [Nakamurella alba]MTD12785.1 GntR family transcriptional regulator [Nakamurella alba]